LGRSGRSSCKGEPIREQEYFESAVIPCEDCGIDPAIADFLAFTKLQPFIGVSERRVLLLGHSPKVRTSSKITTTLDLAEERQLRRYVVGEVLTPLGIDLQSCYATNAVKCLTTRMPEDIAVELQFMERAFSYCKRHFLEELVVIKPKLVISFSERISTLLQTQFASYKPVLPMKELFGTMRSLEVNGTRIPWIPVVHVPKAKVRQHYFPEQTSRLTALSQAVSELLA
jgi:hypothetical protein